MTIRFGSNKWIEEGLDPQDLNDTLEVLTINKGTTFFIQDTDNSKIIKTISDFNDSLLISDCEDIIGWSGTSVSQDTTEYAVGSASVKDDVTSPTASTEYSTIFTPSSALDLSSKKYLFFKFKDSRNSTDYTVVKVVIKTDSSNYGEWNITYLANFWTDILIDLSNPDSTTGTLDLSSITEISIVKTTADTTAYSHNIDNIVAISNDYEVIFNYDSNDNITSVEYYQNGILLKTITYYYDTNMNIIKILSN